MLLIFGFLLASILAAIGGLAYVIANQQKEEIQEWAKNFFGVCGIAAMVATALLIFQLQAIQDRFTELFKTLNGGR